MIYAVTGATGHLGRLAVTSLLAHGVDRRRDRGDRPQRRAPGRARCARRQHPGRRLLRPVQALAASGMRHTFLRNGWYLENYTDQLPTHLEHGAILGSAEDGWVSAATRADLAELLGRPATTLVEAVRSATARA